MCGQIKLLPLGYRLPINPRAVNGIIRRNRRRADHGPIRKAKVDDLNPRHQRSNKRHYRRRGIRRCGTWYISTQAKAKFGFDHTLGKIRPPQGRRGRMAREGKQLPIERPSDMQHLLRAAAGTG